MVHLIEQVQRTMNMTAGADPRRKEAAFQRWLVGVRHCQKGNIGWVPFRGEIESTLLYPPVKILIRDPIGAVEQWMIWLQRAYRSSRIGDAPADRGTSGLQPQWRALRFVPIVDRAVILAYEMSAALDPGSYICLLYTSPSPRD